MAIKNPEKQLSRFQLILPAAFGAAVTLLAVAIADAPNIHPTPFFPGWYGVWLFIQVGTVVPAILLWSGSGLRSLPFPDRLNAIFGYLAAGWIALAAFGVYSQRLFTLSCPSFFGIPGGIGIALTYSQLVLVIGCVGLFIGAGYGFLRRKHISAPEAMFP